MISLKVEYHSKLERIMVLYYFWYQKKKKQFFFFYFFFVFLTVGTILTWRNLKLPKRLHIVQKIVDGITFGHM